MIRKSHYETPTANKQAQIESDVRELRRTVATLTKQLEELQEAYEKTRANVQSIPLHGSIR